MEHVIWCSGCSAEPAVELVEIEWNNEWVSFPVGAECLTRLQENAKMNE